jgi:ATP-dependent Lon protease
MTGSLGDVMKESATLAYKYLQANAEELSIPAEMFTNYDVHIHVPDGSTPKDGPSAGITISTALASTLTGKKIREKTAMTGEITLRGKVTPVGGIKEKILAAKRAGIENIILCEDNKKHIEEINEKYIEGVNFVYVDTIMDVLKYALIED